MSKESIIKGLKENWDILTPLERKSAIYSLLGHRVSFSTITELLNKTVAEIKAAYRGEYLQAPSTLPLIPAQTSLVIPEVCNTTSLMHPKIMQIAPEKQMYNLSFDDLLEHYRKLIGWDKYNSNQEVGVGPNDPDYINGIIISDIHAPFHDEHAFTKMIEQNKGKVDVCILAGDGPDFHAASRFPKFGEYFNVQQEHKAFMVILAMLSEAFPEVIMTPGNHDARTRKMYAGFLGPQWYQVLIDVHQQPDLFDLAEVMARQFKNIVIPKSPTYDWAVYRHIYQYHDIVIGHPEVYSKVANVAVGKFIDVMKKQAEPMGLIKPFSVAVMGHTHQAGKCFHDFGIIGIENASLCMTPDYAGSAKMTGAPRPPVHGYTRFKINRRTGKTDKNDINLIYI